MRILQVTPVYYPELQFGGPPQKIHALSQGLRARGHQVRVITLHSARPFSREFLRIEGIGVRYLPWVGKGSWRVPLSVNPLMRAVRWADVVHCYGLYDLLCPAAAFFSLLMGVPYFSEPLGMYVPRARSVRAKRLYHLVFTKWILHAASGIIATSPAEIEELKPQVPSGKLTLRRNGVDLHSFRDLPSGDAFKVRYKIAPEERIILYIGRISPIKNLLQLIEAYDIAALADTRLVLVGPALEPDYLEELRTLIHGRGLRSKVLLTGPLYAQQKMEALAAANLFVLPSISESFGNAAAEAVAAGIPVLLTEGCGIAPMIHRRAGLCVALSTSALVDGLRRMMCDAKLRAELTCRQAEVLTELSWDEPLKQMTVLYAEAATGGNRS